MRKIIDKGTVQCVSVDGKGKDLEIHVEEKRRRFKPAVRKAQIIEATKKLILKNGLPWASSLRISQALGISQAALYHHFKSKREILLETLSSSVNEIILKVMPAQSQKSVEDYIRDAARAIYELALSDPQQSRLFFEFVLAPPTEDLREEVQVLLSTLLNIIEDSVRMGIAAGIFRDDLDVTLVAWQFASLGIGLNIGMMMKMPKFLSMEQAMSAVEVILQSIRKSPA